LGSASTRFAFISDDRWPEIYASRPRGPEPAFDPFADQVALEFGKVCHVPLSRRHIDGFILGAAVVGGALTD
jgi:hypothetical protein